MAIIGSLITFPDKGVGVRRSTAIGDTDVSQIHPRCSVALGSDDAFLTLIAGLKLSPCLHVDTPKGGQNRQLRRNA
jgi:hypothetical protein